MSEALRGPKGTAEPMTIPNSKPDHEGHLAGWLIASRETGMPWWQFQLSVVHLRPIAGARPAVFRFRGATHEVVLLAYDPEREVTADGVKQGGYLQPYNFCAQFVTTDEKAIALAEHLVRLALDGTLHLEPRPGAATAALVIAGAAPWLEDRTGEWRQAIEAFVGPPVR